MPKRELKINTDNKLYSDTQEDIILKPPFRIPDKGLQDLISLRAIEGTNCSYYDIALTEKQHIVWQINYPITYHENDEALSPDSDYQSPSLSTFNSSTDLNMNMGIIAE